MMSFEDAKWEVFAICEMMCEDFHCDKCCIAVVKELFLEKEKTIEVE